MKKKLPEKAKIEEYNDLDVALRSGAVILGYGEDFKGERLNYVYVVRSGLFFTFFNDYNERLLLWRAETFTSEDVYKVFNINNRLYIDEVGIADLDLRKMAYTFS